MASPKLLTIFGATGNQGGSVLDVVFAHPDLQQKYRLRGVTRNPSSSHAQALSQKGVEMVKADLNDLDALKSAVRDSYGVFGVRIYSIAGYAKVTNFWDKDVLSKDIEIQQGKNIFDACKAKGVTHYVYSSLPYVTKLTNGALRGVRHFDGKAVVAEHIEANKGDMIASYFMPAMYLKSAKDETRLVDGKVTLNMPFEQDANFAWPLLEPRSDSGKYIMGLFEGANEANGVHVHAVTAWTSVKELLAAMSQESGTDVTFHNVPEAQFQSAHPELIAEDITQTMLLVGGYSYYGPGQEKKQAEHNKWLVEGSTTVSLHEMVKAAGPWQF